MEPNLPSILIFALLAGGIFTFLGFVIKVFNAGDMINYFDEKKHDKNKVSKRIGLNFLIIGLSVIFLAIFSFFVNKKFYNFIMITQVFIIIVGLIISILHSFCFVKSS